MAGIRKIGRPLKFESPEILQKKIDNYFENTPENEWTITGLAYHLDTDRITLIHYEEKPEFINTIKKAKTRVEMAYEKSLRKRGSSGDIFGLKNFGWSDKQEIDQTNTHSFTKMPTIEVDNQELEIDIGD